jgi:CheY-like chemotaxis protein
MRVPRRILVIDDEEAIREVTQVTLETFAGWIITTASSGREGIARAAQDPPDAILLDVMMPDMDGPSTFKELCQNPATRHIPVLFLTAKVQAADIEAFRNLGAKAVIAKPFDPMSLAHDVSKVLGWEPEAIQQVGGRR